MKKKKMGREICSKEKEKTHPEGIFSGVFSSSSSIRPTDSISMGGRKGRRKKKKPLKRGK